MSALLRVAAADVVLVLAGLAVVGPPARRLAVPVVPRLATAFVTGAGLLALVGTVTGVLGGPTGVLPLVGPALGAAAVAGLVLTAGPAARRWRTSPTVPGGPARWPRADGAWFGYAVTATVTTRFAAAGWHNPVYSNDEYMMWALRGRVLAAGHLDPLVFGGAANDMAYQSREYPLGLPVLYSWVSGWAGPRWAEVAAHIQVPLLGGAALLVAVWTLRTTSGVPAGVLVAPAFFAVAWVGRYTGVLFFADLPVAAAGLVVALLVLHWLRTRQPGCLLLAVGPAVAAVLLKEEGLVFVTAPCLAAAGCALTERRRQPAGRWWLPLVLLGAALAARLPWQLWLAGQGVGSRFLRPPQPRYGAADTLHLIRLVGQQLIRLWPEPYPVVWIGLPVLLSAALAVLLPPLRRDVCYLGGTLVLLLGGIWAQYVLVGLADPNGPDGLAGYMAFNAPRVLLLPTVLCWVLALLAAGATLTRPAPAPPAPPAPEAPRAGVSEPQMRRQ